MKIGRNFGFTTDGDDMEKLENKAREAGRTTQFSATEASDAMYYMALAGWDAEFSDVLAKTSATTNTDVSQLGEALKYAGANASAMGLDIQQTSAILGLFADIGIKGSMAGTTLNAILRDMTKKAEDGKMAIGDMTVSIYDGEGNMRDFGDILADVEKATDGMSDSARNNALQQYFGQEAIRGMNILLEEGSDKYKDLEEEIYDSKGAAEKMADVVNDNLKGSFKELSSIFSDVAIDIYKILEPALKAIVDKLIQFGTWLNNLSPQAKVAMVAVAGIAASIGPLLYALGTLSTVGGHVFTVIGKGFKGIAKAGGELFLLTSLV